jgi:hypothetical protein
MILVGRKKSLSERQAEMRLRPPGRNKQHRQTKTPTYVSWWHMIARCRSNTSDGYKHYGAKGVKIVPRWGDFRNFLADMGERPSGTTLGRILDRGNYGPRNCFWMTKPEQGLHQRNNNSLRRWKAGSKN